jgi:hypothetical protein
VIAGRGWLASGSASSGRLATRFMDEYGDILYEHRELLDRGLERT